jgi:hypothetical protein
LFLQVAVTERLFMSKKASFPEVEEKLPSYLNERQQFGYVV